MKLISFGYFLLSLNLCTSILAVTVDGNLYFNTQKLLKRLETAQGDNQSIALIEILAKIRDGEKVDSKAVPVVGVIESIEEIVVLSTQLHDSGNFLTTVKNRTNELAKLNFLVQSKIASLSRKSQFLYGSSLSKITSRYLTHEMYSMQRLKHKLYAVPQETENLQGEIYECLIRCNIALQATFKSLALLQSRDIVTINMIIQKAFHNSRKSDPQDLGDSLAVSIAAQRDPATLESDIKYLRENLAVIIKSGMFMFFCFAFQIYICSFTFGVLLTVSSLIWIAIFLQLIDVQ